MIASTHYNQIADFYNKYIDNSVYYNPDLIVKNLVDLVGNSGTILDLGCGTGKLDIMLAKTGFDIVACDSSKQMLEIFYRSLETTPDLIQDKIQILEPADIHRYDFGSLNYDIILSNGGYFFFDESGENIITFATTIENFEKALYKILTNPSSTTKWIIANLNYHKNEPVINLGNGISLEIQITDIEKLKDGIIRQNKDYLFSGKQVNHHQSTFLKIPINFFEKIVDEIRIKAGYKSITKHKNSILQGYNLIKC